MQKSKTDLNIEYEELMKKYDLPSYNEINYEFEISTLDIKKINSLSRGILRAMTNKMALFLNYVEPVISPNPQGLHAFIEAQNTSNDEKKEAFDFYKKISKMYHKAYSMELLEDEKTVIEEIKNILKDWRKIKTEFKKLSEIINSSWEREAKKEEIETIG